MVGLTIAGVPTAAGPGGRFNLGDWGYLVTLAQAASPTAKTGVQGYIVSQAALLVHLNLDHGGLPAGSEILIGYADALAEAALPKPAKPKVKPVRPSVPPDDRVRPKREQDDAKDSDEARPGTLPPLLPVPQGLDVRLTSGGYVFPVYGPTGFSDTFGAGRATTGWHHGEDIFAPLGAPILAVTDGTVFSVGWNDVGGLRVWLRDRHGNEFYYAHLSAFSQLAVDGNQVEAGDVLGFVGNTGDAEHTPYHLHFEIHPASMLHRGYDGVINAYRYLIAWQRLSDVAFAQVAGWAAPIAPWRNAPNRARSSSPRDISTADGLDPASIGAPHARGPPPTPTASLVGARQQFLALLRRFDRPLARARTRARGPGVEGRGGGGLGLSRPRRRLVLCPDQVRTPTGASRARCTGLNSSPSAIPVTRSVTFRPAVRVLALDLVGRPGAGRRPPRIESLPGAAVDDLRQAADKVQGKDSHTGRNVTLLRDGDRTRAAVRTRSPGPRRAGGCPT